MGIRIPESVKYKVVQAWLMGKSREQIASECDIGDGTVTNIIDQFRTLIGTYEVSSLRELGKALKKSGISPVDCSESLRISNICKQFGIVEDDLYNFLTRTYMECQNHGLLPSKLMSYLNDINLNFPGIESISDIPRHIQKMSEEKNFLEKKIAYLKCQEDDLIEETEITRTQFEYTKKKMESLNQKYEDDSKDILLFKSLKEEFKKNDIPFVTIEPFLSVLKIFKDFHFDPLKINWEFSSIQNYPIVRQKRIEEEQESKLRLKDLQLALEATTREISSNHVMFQALDDLANLGFDLYDLKRIAFYIQGLSELLRDKLDKKEIKNIFFNILENIPSLEFLEQQIADRKKQNLVLQTEIAINRNILKSQPIVFSTIQRMVKSGLTEDQLLSFIEIITKDMNHTLPSDNQTYLDSLTKDLRKYTTVRKTLKNLDLQISQKRSELNQVSKDRQKLEDCNYFLFRYIHYQLNLLKLMLITNTWMKTILQNKFVFYFYLLFVLLNVCKNFFISSLSLNRKNKDKKRKPKNTNIKNTSNEDKQHNETLSKKS